MLPDPTRFEGPLYREMLLLEAHLFKVSYRAGNLTREQATAAITEVQEKLRAE